MRNRKIVSLLLLILLLTVMLPVGAMAQDIEDIQFNTDNIERGIIGVQYNEDSEEKLKVKVQRENGERTVYYDLHPQTMEYYPLQLGNGTYEITVLAHKVDNLYVRLEKISVEVSLKDTKEIYLQSVQNVKWDSSMEPIKKAEILTEGLTTDKEKVKALYTYMVNHYAYDYEKARTVATGYVPDIETTFQKKTGICYDYASLYAAMLRSLDIPTRLVKGYSTQMEGYHAWNEVYLEGEGWLTVDTTVDAYYEGQGQDYQMVKAADEYVKNLDY